MPCLIPKSLVDSLAYDLAAEVKAFQDAVTAHALTVDQPAPTAISPLVEEIVYIYGGIYTVVDDDPPVVDDPVVEPTPPTLDEVYAECKARIYAKASEATQSNLNAYINVLNATVAGGTALTDPQKADIALFIQAFEWIEAMRGVCPGLVGNLDYRADSHWPSLDPNIAAFAARF